MEAKVRDILHTASSETAAVMKRWRFTAVFLLFLFLKEITAVQNDNINIRKLSLYLDQTNVLRSSETETGRKMWSPKAYNVEQVITGLKVLMRNLPYKLIYPQLFNSLEERSKIKGTLIPKIPSASGLEGSISPKSYGKVTDIIPDGHTKVSDVLQTTTAEKYETAAESTNIGLVLPPDVSSHFIIDSGNGKTAATPQLYYVPSSLPLNVQRGPIARYSPGYVTSAANTPSSLSYGLQRYGLPNNKRSTKNKQHIIPRIPRPTKKQKNLRPPPPQSSSYDPIKDAPPPSPVFEIPPAPSPPKSFQNFDFTLPGEPKYLREAFSGSSLSESYDSPYPTGGRQVPFIHNSDHPAYYGFVQDRVNGNTNEPIPIPAPVIVVERPDPITVPKVDLSKFKYDKNGCREVVKTIHPNDNESKNLKESVGYVTARECLYPETSEYPAKSSTSNNPGTLYHPLSYAKHQVKVPEQPRRRGLKPVQSKSQYQSSKSYPEIQKVKEARIRDIESTAKRRFEFKAPEYFEHDLIFHLQDFPDSGLGGQNSPKPSKYQKSDISQSSTDSYTNEEPPNIQQPISYATVPDKTYEEGHLRSPQRDHAVVFDRSFYGGERHLPKSDVFDVSGHGYRGYGGTHGGYGSRHTGPSYRGPDHGRIGQKNRKPKNNFNKSFFYYRKDDKNKSPNSPGYNEEYVRGRFRSFSTDYDSKRDDKRKH